jgi:flagellar hook-associated protein 1 FlgK
MPDILSTSVSGLLAFQQALDTTSQNVTNVDTPGYSREAVNLTEAPGQSLGTSFVGGGVDVSSITRAYDELLAQQVRSSQSSYSSFNTVATQATQIDNMLSASGTGLTATLQSFVNSLQSVANSPSSTAQRQALLSQAQALTQQLQSYDSQISQYSADVESQISTSVTQINTLASNIASLNQQIAATAGSASASPNQLLDERDQDIDQLSQYVNVNTVTEGNGAMDVFIGSGQSLVLGSTAEKLTTIPNAYDASSLDIGLEGGGGSTADVSSEISGGSLGGLLTVRSQVLDPAQNALGQISVGLATVVNQQQQSGMDLTGAQGQAMFAVGGVQTLTASNNVGTAALAVTRTNLSALTADDYTLQFAGGAWHLSDTTTGQAVAMTGSGTSASPFEAAGLAIVVSGAPASADSFLIRPTAAATAGLSMQLTNPSQIAAASLIQGTSATSNAGTGTVSSAAVTSPGTWVPDTYTVSFTSPSQYQVVNSSNTVVATGTYTGGAPIAFNGAQVTIAGAPAAGDTFTVSNNSAANTGDNSNVFAMIDALGASVLNGATTSLSGAANDLVSQVGVVTQQAQANASAQQTVNQSAVDARNSVTGVNLDEEAANLVQEQQAYQACAQMIQASGVVFNSLITAITNGQA